MMKTIEIAFTGKSGGNKVYIPVKDPCRLISGLIGVTTAQDSAAYLVTIGKAGEAEHILQIDLNLDNVGAGEVAKLVKNGSASQVQEKQIFDSETPIEIEVPDLNADTKLVLQLVVDPFLIGAHEGLSS